MQLIKKKNKAKLVATNNCLQRWAKAMKTNLSNDRNILFKLACKGLKYLMLALLGFALAYILSGVFGADTIVKIISSPRVWEWFLRIAILIFCFFAIAIEYESSN